MQTLTQNTNTDGFPYVVETHTSPVETELIACENASQVLATIVDGYTELNDDEALKSPITLIEDQVLPLVNERVYSDYLEKNGFARLAPADEEVLLSREKDSFGHIDWQLADIPLAAASTQFAPFTEAPVPTGNVLVVDVTNELAVIRTLNNFGLITLYESADEEASE